MRQTQESTLTLRFVILVRRKTQSFDLCRISISLFFAKSGSPTHIVHDLKDNHRLFQSKCPPHIIGLPRVEPDTVYLCVAPLHAMLGVIYMILACHNMAQRPTRKRRGGLVLAYWKSTLYPEQYPTKDTLVDTKSARKEAIRKLRASTNPTDRGRKAISAGNLVVVKSIMLHLPITV